MLTFITFSFHLTQKLCHKFCARVHFRSPHAPIHHLTQRKSFRTLAWSIHIHTLHKRTTVAIALLIAHFVDAPKSKLVGGPSVVYVCVLWHKEKLPVFSMCKFRLFPLFVLLFRVFLCCPMPWRIAVCVCQCVFRQGGTMAANSWDDRANKFHCMRFLRKCSRCFAVLESLTGQMYKCMCVCEALRLLDIAIPIWLSSVFLFYYILAYLWVRWCECAPYPGSHTHTHHAHSFWFGQRVRFLACLQLPRRVSIT